MAMGTAVSVMMGPVVVGGVAAGSAAPAPAGASRTAKIRAATIIRTVALKDGAGPFLAGIIADQLDSGPGKKWG